MAKNSSSFQQRRVGIHNLITYGHDSKESGVSSRLEPGKRPFGGKFPLFSTIAAAAVVTGGFLIWGMFPRNEQPSVHRCTHTAMAEYDFEYNNWRRKIAKNVWEGDEAKEALSKLIAKKEQMNQKFRQKLEACTLLPE